MKPAYKIVAALLFVAAVIVFAKQYIYRPAPPPETAQLIRSDSHKLVATQSRATIVMFVDYQCEGCAFVHTIINQLLAKYPDQYTIVIRHYPLSDHPHSYLAAEVAEAAAQQRKFWPMHEELLQTQKRWTNLDNARPFFDELAAKLGLNQAEFSKSLDTHKHEAKINQDIDDAKALGVTFVPTVFIDGKNEGYIKTLAEFESKLPTLTNVPTPSPQTSFSMEFEILNAAKNYQKDTSYPLNSATEIVVASATLDVRTFLPITLKIRSGKKLFTNTIPNQPTQVCRGADGCSIPGPVIETENQDQPLELLALGKNGQPLAYFSENVPSGSPSLKDETASPQPLALKPSPSAPPNFSTASTPKPTPLAQPSPTVEAFTNPTPPPSPQTVPGGNKPKPDTTTLAGVALALAGAFIGSKFKDCKDKCKNGECKDCTTEKRVRVDISEHELALEGVKSISWIEWPPIYYLNPLHDEGDVIDAEVQTFITELTRIQKGVIIEVVIRYKKCVPIPCLGPFTKLDWKNMEEVIEIPPLDGFAKPDYYRKRKPGEKWDPQPTDKWDSRHVMNPKNQTKIDKHIQEYLQSKLPDCCKK